MAADRTAASSEYEQVRSSLSSYAKDRVERVLKEMLYEMFLHTPSDPIQFMIDYLRNIQESGESFSADGSGEHDASASGHTDDNHDDEPRHELAQLPVISTSGAQHRARRGARRAAVSSEPMNAEEIANAPTRVVPKTEDDRAHIRRAVSSNILFTGLDEDEMKVVIDAMASQEFKKGDTIIKQGDSGDSFYILEAGVCECFLKLPNWEEPRCVKTYEHRGDSFGELALMYNAPRAASIIAKTDVVVWEMDRLTFRKTLLKSTSDKRSRYEGFLAKVPLLASLDRYERSKVADALVEVSFHAGECIIAEGDVGHSMYFLREGEAVATKVLPGSDEPREVMHYSDGSYFGELALLKDAPRAANVYAVTDCKCVYIDREDFDRLLGPCDQILKRNSANYEAIEAKIARQKLRGDDNDANNADGDVDEEDAKAASAYRRRRRQNVFAEPMDAYADKDFKPVVVPKTEAQVAAIRKAISHNFLFQSLDPDSLQIVVDAMAEKKYEKGDTIIRQGDEGDAFYILHKGTCHCFVKMGADEPRLVKVYQPGEAFGELALMYNAPRAATITAETPVTVYAVDRMTFHRVIMDTANKKRQMYEDFLRNVKILESLDDYERKTVADALESVTYADGEYIITEGELGDNFYILERGEAKATKKLDDGSTEPVEVYRYNTPGQYFGELALLHDQPRAANVIAVGECRCVHLDRSAFTRLLGPLEEILSRNKAQYEEIETRLKKQEQ